jgi:outer membrane protein OmpA-like peptidoglycan-associated protein
VGAAGGAYFAEQDAGKDRTIDELEVRLDERDGQLAELRADFEQTQVAMTGDVAVLPRNPDAPISLPVYFRTDAATVDDSLRPHLTQLVAYLQAYPELDVRLEGYSDQRGNRGYAYGESRAAAATGDADAMIFDRAVVISVGEIDSTRA